MRRRYFVGLGLVAILVISGSTGTAAPVFVVAQTPSATGVPVPGPASSPATEQTPAAAPAPSPATATHSVSYLAGRYRINAADAQRRLQLQTDSAALDEDLARRYPDEYAGMWMDQANGGVLRVAMTRPELVPAIPGVVAVAAQRSLRQLELEVKNLRANGVNAVIDEQNNRVVAAEPIPGEELKCNPLRCPEDPIRGGVRLDIPRDDATVGGCSAGYLLRSSANGQVYLLTAGHCVISGTHTHRDNVFHDFLGAKHEVSIEDTNALLAENNVDLGYDYAIMPFTAKGQTVWFPSGQGQRRPGKFYHLANYNDLVITGYTPRASVKTGWVVCASGSGYTPRPGENFVDSGAGAGYAPGTHCGEVTAVGNRISVRICARNGDSGGPLFTEADGKALGILSGGDSRRGPCVAGDTEQNHYSAISTILERVNARTALGFTFGPIPATTVTPRR